MGLTQGTDGVIKVLKISFKLLIIQDHMDDDVFDPYEGMYNPYEREFDDQSHFEVRLRFIHLYWPYLTDMTENF